VNWSGVRSSLSPMSDDLTAPIRPKTLILDVFGRYAEQLGGWIAVSDLVTLMSWLDVDEQAVRSAVSRMCRRGLLTAEVRDRVRGYAPTPTAVDLLNDGDRRIFAFSEPARLEDGWVLVSFSLPETNRDLRHRLRSQLMWLGFGNLTNGLWIGPARLQRDATEAIGELGLSDYCDVFTARYEAFGTPQAMVARSWDLSTMADAYAQFLRSHRLVKPGLRREGASAFRLYTLALHDWRKLVYLDPGLPISLLPSGWAGDSARTLFHAMRNTLEPSAMSFVASVVAPIAHDV
jgi:phenylacetic acid degradation operon negative regulatory protein